MSSKRYFVIAEIANVILIFIFWLTLGWTYEILTAKNASILTAIGILLIVIYSYLSRVLARNLIVYIVMQVIMLALAIFLPYNPLSKILICVIALIFVILNLMYWYNNNDDGYAYIAMGFALAPAIGYLVADIRGVKAAMSIYFIMGVSYIILYYVRLLCINAYSLSGEKRKNEKMPYEDMIKNDAKLSVPFILISAALMLIARFDALDAIVFNLYLKFADFLGFVILKTLDLVEIIYNFLFGSDVQVANVPLFQPENLDENQSPLFNYFSWIVFAAVGAFLVFLVIKAIISIIKQFSMKKEMGAETIEDSDMVEIREKIVRIKKINNEKLSKIRKRYKRTIEKKAKAGYKIEKYHTPYERAKDIKAKMDDDIFELNAMYEEERYRNK